MATEVRPCDCVGNQYVVVKQPGAKTEICPRWETPWFMRNVGAKVQDAMYGVGMRLHNQMVKAGKKLGWRCTVCDRVKLV